MIGLELMNDRQNEQLTLRQQKIIDIVREKGRVSISDIQSLLDDEVSIPTLNRELALLVKCNYLLRFGESRAISYELSPAYAILAPIFDFGYFDVEPDFRKSKTNFNYEIFDSLAEISLFTKEENSLLKRLQAQYQSSIEGFPECLYQKELERLIIELSWKSAQIEGNTYSLLETEQLFVDSKAAQGKSQKEATMLLNHKYALNYILENKDIAQDLNLRLIEEIHSLLIKDLDVGRNIRSHVVGITGTAYKPLGNSYQIREALQKMCELINGKKNHFEKSLLALLLISYIQPFEDGNKRTARMISNAILVANGACPLSYRSVDSLDYKKAMLLFYEQNNILLFKQIFIEQNIFSSKNYFQKG